MSKEDLDRFQLLMDAHAELLDLKGDFALLRKDIESLFAELTAARAVVAAARPLGNDPAYVDIPQLSFDLRAALTAYDASQKASDA